MAEPAENLTTEDDVSSKNNENQDPSLISDQKNQDANEPADSSVEIDSSESIQKEDQKAKEKKLKKSKTKTKTKSDSTESSDTPKGKTK